MKAKIFSVLLVIFLSTYSVNGQINVFSSAEETARRLDSLEGKSRPQSRENSNANRNNGESRSNNQARERWERMFEARMVAFKEGMDYFDTQGTRCVYIMVIYVDTYKDIVKSTEEAQDSRTICDGYALQLAAIASSATIMYCPESYTTKTRDERARIIDNLKTILLNEDNHQFIIDWKEKFDNISNPRDPTSERIFDLVEYFRPEFFVNQLIAIQQNMEALGCSE